MFARSLRLLTSHAPPRALHTAAARTSRVPVLAQRSLCTVPVTFVEDGEEINVDAEVGKTLLEVAHDNDIDLEGACDGSLACSTCHLILTQDVYDQLPPPEEEEEDMLDLAFDLTDTSRLGCQIKVDKSLAGMVVTVPSGAFDLTPK